MEELTPFHQRKDLQGCVYEEHSGYIPPFLEGFRIRISQKTMSCLISRKFFGGKNSFKKFDSTEKYNEKIQRFLGM
jgi:hypothetical protein